MKTVTALAIAAGTLTLTGAAPPKTGEVAITVTDLRNTKGVVRACMTTKEDIFPKCRKDPAAHRAVVPAGEEVVIVFTDVTPGRYAVALLHDENENGKPDRVLGMMPKEGFGFSRDAKVQMGPPKFEDAVFDYTGDGQSLTIRMRYML